jgi:hypothetical protein
MITSYVVSSPSRVGSTFLTTLLTATGKPVVSTHNHCYKVENPASTGIIFLTRKDLFRSIMSALIWKRKHSGTSFPFTMPLNDLEFRRAYRWHKWYVQNAVKPDCARIEYWYFEDFVNTPETVFEKLGEVQRSSYVLPKEEKLSYKELVLNHSECFAEFVWCENNLEYFKNTLVGIGS